MYDIDELQFPLTWTVSPYSMLEYTSWLKVSIPLKTPQMLNAIIRALPGSSGELIFTSSVINVMINLED